MDTMHKNNNEAGLVSIIVTVIIMLILSLTVIAFAKIARREQRQSLDRQLNAQAFYAAESGVNDVQEYIKNQLALGVPPSNFTYTTNCSDFTTDSGISNVIDGSTTYSCALVNPSPGELVWQHVSSAGSLVFPFNPSAAIPGITFSWQDADSVPSTYAACPASVPVDSFGPQGGWNCQAGALRVDLTPMGSLNRDALIDNTKNFVLYPIRTGGSTNVAYGSLGHGNIVPVSCSAATTPRHCSITIDGASGNFFIRIRPLYRSASIVADPVGTATLSGAQAIVDVTGKSNDILKRLQVRVPIDGTASRSNSIFDYAIQTRDTLCKPYLVLPPSTITVYGSLNSPPDSSCSFP